MSILAAAPFKLLAAYGVAVVLGLGLCLAGQRFFRVALVALGFVLGATVGAGIGLDAGDGGRTAWLLGMLLGGAGGALLLGVFWQAGVFVLGAGFGAAALTALFRTAGWGRPEPVLVVAAAALLGTIALLVKKPLVILGTAFGGAFVAVTGVAGVLSHYDGQPLYEAIRKGFRKVYEHDPLLDLFVSRPAYFWAALGLTVVGAVVQAVFTSAPSQSPSTMS